MEDKKLNEKESLELISRMIRNSKKNLAVEGFGNQFLLWGYLGVVVGLAVFVLVTVTRDENWNYMLLLIPGLGIPVMMQQYKKKKASMVKTFTDDVLEKVWKAVLVVGVLPAAALCAYYGKMYMMTGILLALCALGMVITGEIIKNRWMSKAGQWSIIFGICIIIRPGSELEGWYPQYLFLVVCFVFMFIIPGRKLNKEKKENV